MKLSRSLLVAWMSVVGATPLNFTCVGDLEVSFATGSASCGNTLEQTAVQSQPGVKFGDAEKNGLYLFAMIDPDACLGDTDPCGSWTPGTKAAPGTSAPVRHWLVGNIYGQTLKLGNMMAQ